MMIMMMKIRIVCWQYLPERLERVHVVELQGTAVTTQI